MGISVPVSSLNYAGGLLLYQKALKEKLHKEAIFSDETENFRMPSEPSCDDEVKVILRTYRDNTDGVYIVSQGNREKMKLERQEGQFDYFCKIFPPTSNTLTYYFEIEKEEKLVYYTKIGVSDSLIEEGIFRIIRGFKTPNWAKGAVMYQVYVDRFYNGDKRNDIKTNEYIYLGKPAQFIEDWNKRPATDDVRNFYGGDLQGVMDKMNYLKDLGIEVIYFNPIFVSPSNHKYDIQDYDYVDPHFGVILKDGGQPLAFEKFNNRAASMYIQRTTEKANLEASNRLFIKLVRLAHSHGMKVILDGVFNHCGAFNKWLDREGFYGNSGKYPVGAYRDKKSSYNSYFKWYENDNWPNNDAYDGWWGYDNHPKLNYEASPALYEYMMHIAKKWVAPPYNADGWRLDVAADLGHSEEFNHKFWRDFRKSVKEGNPNAVILAEHYGDPSAWLQGDQWDTIMNYDAFMEPVTWFLTGMEKHSEEFRGDLLCNAKVFEDGMLYNMAKFSIQSLQTAMNELSNHDHSRFLTRTSSTVGRLHTKGSEAADFGVNYGIMKEAVAIQMTWPGAPTVYYGDEAGVTGWTDPDNRRTYPWGNENQELIAFHQAAIQVHKRYQALKTGSVKILYTDYGMLSFGRFDKEDRIVTIVNNTNSVKEFFIPVWQIGTGMECRMVRLLCADETSFDTKSEWYPVSGGILRLDMPAFGCMILRETI